MNVRCLVFDRAIGLRDLLLQIGASKNNVAKIMRCIINSTTCIDFTKQSDFVTTYDAFMDALEKPTDNEKLSAFRQYLQSKYITKSNHLFSFKNYKIFYKKDARVVPFLIARSQQYVFGIRLNKLYNALLKCAPRYFVKNLECFHFDTKIPKLEAITIDVEKEYNEFLRVAETETAIGEDTNDISSVDLQSTDSTKTTKVLKIKFNKLKRVPDEIIIIF